MIIIIIIIMIIMIITIIIIIIINIMSLTTVIEFGTGLCCGKNRKPKQENITAARGSRTMKLNMSVLRFPRTTTTTTSKNDRDHH